jgi:AcrR family transcriptional regulator
VQDLAEVVGVSRATVFNYLRAFEEKGGAFVRAKDAHLVRQLLASLLHRQLSKRLREILKFQIFQGLVLVACHQRLIAD